MTFMTEVYIGLGSNVGDKEGQLRRALEVLDASEGIRVKAVSNFLPTKAVSRVRQPDFINAAAKIETYLTPDELLTVLCDIEKKMGRESKGNYDPRTLDLDILFYGDQIVCTDHLTIPHPLLHERLFVLTPLAEIASDFVHPVLGVRIRNLEKQLLST